MHFLVSSSNTLQCIQFQVYYLMQYDLIPLQHLLDFSTTNLIQTQCDLDPDLPLTITAWMTPHWADGSAEMGNVPNDMGGGMMGGDMMGGDMMGGDMMGVPTPDQSTPDQSTPDQSTPDQSTPDQSWDAPPNGSDGNSSGWTPSGGMSTPDQSTPDQSWGAPPNGSDGNSSWGAPYNGSDGNSSGWTPSGGMPSGSMPPGGRRLLTDAAATMPDGFSYDPNEVYIAPYTGTCPVLDKQSCSYSNTNGKCLWEAQFSQCQTKICFNGCDNSDIGDNRCDAACNNFLCDYDGGDTMTLIMIVSKPKTLLAPTMLPVAC